MTKLAVGRLLLGALTLVDASSLLSVQSGSPQCTDGLVLNFLKVNCGSYCTFGSKANLTGQGKREHKRGCHFLQY